MRERVFLVEEEEKEDGERMAKNETNMTNTDTPGGWPNGDEGAQNGEEMEPERDKSSPPLLARHCN